MFCYQPPTGNRIVHDRQQHIHLHVTFPRGFDVSPYGRFYSANAQKPSDVGKDRNILVDTSNAPDVAPLETTLLKQPSDGRPVKHDVASGEFVSNLLTAEQITCSCLAGKPAATQHRRAWNSKHCFPFSWAAGTDGE